MYEWVEYAQFRDVLNLQERRQTLVLLELFLSKCCTKVNTILEEVDLAEVHIEKEADDGTDLEGPMLRLLIVSDVGIDEVAKVLRLWLLSGKRIVIEPSLVGEDIACCQVNAPHVLLA